MDERKEETSVGAAHVLLTSSIAGRLDCVSASTGRLVWSQEAGKKLTGHSAQAVLGGIACVGGVDGSVHAFRSCDGQLLGSAELPAPIFSSPVLHADQCIVGCRDDGLWCLAIS